MVGGIGFFAATPVAQVHAVDDGLLVDGHVDGLAHAHVVEGLLRDVVRQVADVQAGLLQHLHVRVLADRVQVGRVRVRHDVALALLQLGPAHRRVGRDREHQVVDLGLAAPVLREGLEADDRVLLVLHQVERAGADRVLVDLLGRAGLQHGDRRIPSTGCPRTAWPGSQGTAPRACSARSSRCSRRPWSTDFSSLGMPMSLKYEWFWLVTLK
jgi:hypothetical protein